MMSIKRISALFLCLLTFISLFSCTVTVTAPERVSLSVITGEDETQIPAANFESDIGTTDGDSESVTVPSAAVNEDGTYTSKEDVALYIHTYGKLPDNFISKKEAEKLGWSGGSLEPFAPGKCIGGSRFGNYEGLLPDAPGRTWTECDIDTLGASSRGAKRIVFSNDGLIYYTGDHYTSFTLLYGGDEG